MTSRDAILQRIRTPPARGRSGRRRLPPPVPEVWPRENSDPAALAERFAEELAAVHGETIRCATMDEARRQLAELMEPAGWPTLGAVDRPLAREVGRRPAGRSGVAWVEADWNPRGSPSCRPGWSRPSACLADTGTCVIACPTAQERLMCYLPPACVVMARVDQLVEHLPAAWARLAAACAEPHLRGEFVLVTGPSRTADIEKILILGVHGPKRLVVLLVDSRRKR